MNLNKLVQAAFFAAMAIGLGFMFMLVPNLEFISVTVFLSGLTLGMGYGILVGGTAMLIYSSMNPLGSGLIYLTLLLGQIFAMAGIGLLGSISKQFLKIDNPFACTLFAGGIGLMCTLLYDGVTSLTYPISAGYDWDETVAYAISGLIFTFMHLVSNAIIFSLVVPGYIRRISQ